MKPTFALFFLLCSSSWGTTYYVSKSAGNDANTSTQAQSKTTPWAHLPGMPSHPTYTPVAGDTFILMGCDTWVSADLPLHWTWSGTAGNPITITVDQTWYNTSACPSGWNRPKFTNPSGTNFGSPFNYMLDQGGGNYVTIDNIEWTGLVGGGTINAVMGCTAGCGNSTWSNNYIHAWNLPSDTCQIFAWAGNIGTSTDTITRNVIDGSDATVPNQTCGAFSQILPATITYNVIHNVPDGIVGGAYSGTSVEIGGNLIYNLYHSTDPNSHPNFIEILPTLPNNTTGPGTYYIHDNVLHDQQTGGVEAMMTQNPGETDYVWNNIIWNVGNVPTLGQVAGTQGVAYYAYNNTIVPLASGGACFAWNGGPTITVVIKNTHCITTGPLTSAFPGTPTLSNNVLMTPTQATAANYTATFNSYAWSSTSSTCDGQANCPIGAGANLTSLCTGQLTSLCQDTAYAAGLNATTHAVIVPGRAQRVRPTGGAWDASAYQLANAWYVDNAVVGGAGNGTSWANAWASFAAVTWASIHAGDVLYISGGTTSQTYTESWTIGASGASGNPITITPGVDSGHNGTVIFDYAACAPSCAPTAITANQNYVTLEGLVGGVSKMQLNNLYNTSAGTSSIGISGAGPNTGLVIDGITFTNDNNPIRLTQSNGVTISNNLFSGTRGDANIAMGVPFSPGAFGLNKIFSNDFETYVTCSTVPCTVSPTGGPDGVQNGGNEDIYNNTFHVIATTQATSGQHPDMVEPVGNFMRIYNNEFHNVGDSMIDRDCWFDQNPNSIWIYNNLFRITDTVAPLPVAFRTYCSSGIMGSITNLKFWNNTFADNSSTGAAAIQIAQFNGGNPTGTGIEFRNNIFQNVGNGTSGLTLQIANSTNFNSSSFAFSNNIYATTTGTETINFKGTTFTAANWVASANESNSKTAAPSFVSYTPLSASNNFHLQTGDTAARNSGINLSTDFTTDKDGVVRPSGTAAWDIGAYQFANSGPFLTITPTSFNYGNQTVNTTSAQQAFTITNTGSTAASITAIGITGTNASSFAVASQTCGTFPASLASSASCTANVTFTPTTAAALSANLTVTYNTITANSTLTGTGVAANAPVVSLSPNPSACGQSNLTVAASCPAVTLTNTGNVALTITSIANPTGTAASSFSQTNTCPASLAAAASCTISPVMTPQVAGPLSASIVITTNAATSPDTLSLTGTGINPNAITLVSVTPCGGQTFPGSCAGPTGGWQAGNLLAIGIVSAAGSQPTITSITDASSDAFAQANSGVAARCTDAASNTMADIWWGTLTSGITSLSITPSASTRMAAVIWEFSNVNQLGENAVLNSQAATASPLGAPVSTNSSQEAVVSIADPGSVSVTGIFSGNSFTNDSLLFGEGWAHLLTSSLGTYQAQWNMGSGTYCSTTAAFRQAPQSVNSPGGLSVNGALSNGVIH